MNTVLWPHEFPGSYKQYKVLEEIINERGLTYTEIVKFAFELNGKYKFDKKDNRGYWSGPFIKKSSYPWASHVKEGWMVRLCDHIDNEYYPNTEGFRVYERLQKKFGKMTPTEAMELHAKKRTPALKERKVQMPVTKKAKKIKDIPGFGGFMTAIDDFLENTKPEPRVECSNKVTVQPTSKPVPGALGTPLRGLTLGDKVSYYRHFNNKTGEAVIYSNTFYAKQFGIYNKISLIDQDGLLKDIVYNDIEMKFFESDGSFIEIIKI